MEHVRAQKQKDQLKHGQGEEPCNHTVCNMWLPAPILLQHGAFHPFKWHSRTMRSRGAG